MTSTILAGPNEETPLLGGDALDAPGTSESHSETATPTSQGSPTPSIKERGNTNQAPEAVEETPVPWGQISIALLLQLVEPFIAQLISPVSFAFDCCICASDLRFLVCARGLSRCFLISVEPTD